MKTEDLIAGLEMLVKGLRECPPDSRPVFPIIGRAAADGSFIAIFDMEPDEAAAWLSPDKARPS